ncbi:acetyl-CoA carboxylase carboxyltransferase subunit beta [Pediococcus claussenii]|uniref:Acetyl-coenzyme A carboxylase carboxyl transferase subunit beta n=1 Tax=Pediococcus claussenii (strain ATCC BAA-344 / DSM 14800 / JCM 18046 / KCTC 3811 / LMG 21948 / P06) TaxID=701521 RepID=G8PB47_PEDCP|nr:acetyl-CoA carboxylase carboxyltransferase subunit beta [Pediococcus claussenii]AEV94676.1 acetyl-coA carboxylase, carboxyl transferase beta subunit [Pediococcus claussenii ATCC BAA-344]ANZ69871.1 acetyl-CoA carboxyl transferase [Pediococcus claussenii]ANZ71688.1 acetyl-CoA carboxyl transferase [Pediococcus claussenii]KRN20855.1 accD protein [Pediococcus claussenii]
MSEQLAQKWSKCPNCGKHVHVKQWGTFRRCPFCRMPQRLLVSERLDITFDKGSFEALNFELNPVNKLDFPHYTEKIRRAQDKTGIKDAIVGGKAQIKGIDVAVGIMDNQFMVGTLNTEVGRAIRSIMEYAHDQHLPLILFTASGGARMQEGIFSLLQMNTILHTQKLLRDAGNLTINVLTDPTMGGVSASFAFGSDYVFAEDHAQIGFSGKRVIEQATGEQLPDKFQTAEFLLQHGQLDDVVQREQLRDVLYRMLILHGYGDNFEK